MKRDVLIFTAHRNHTPAPVTRSSGQLAALIRRHDMQGGAVGPFKPQVTVTFQRTTSRRGDTYNHTCRETHLAALCIVGSTPEVDVLKVDVLARGYATVERRSVVAKGCSPP